MLCSGIVLLHITRLHTANYTNETMQKFKWEIFDYPTYNVNLGLSSNKNWLASQIFMESEEVETSIKNGYGQ